MDDMGLGVGVHSCRLYTKTHIKIVLANFPCLILSVFETPTFGMLIILYQTPMQAVKPVEGKAYQQDLLNMS
jgi:hypothetical protein